MNNLKIGAGLYSIGIDWDEALEWCKSQMKFDRPRKPYQPYLHDEDGWVLPLQVALRKTTVQVEAFEISGLIEKSLYYNDALAEAHKIGGRLMTEIEWEVAERYFGGISRNGVDEWCSNLFLEPPNGVMPLVPFGSPEDCRVIRGCNFDICHPCMRFHGAENNAPFATTYYRVAYSD